MKQTTFAQRLTAALVALCMVLSVCAPALAADDRVIWIQKSGGKVQLLNASTIGTKLPGCSYAYDGTTVTITMAASQGEVMEGVTLAGGPSTDIVLVCTNNTRMDGGLGLTITGMRNVTIKTEDPSKTYTGAFYGALKVTNCYGNVTVTNPHGAAVVYSLDVDNTAGTGNVTITGSRADGPICAVGNFGSKVNIASNGDVKIENIVSIGPAQLNYQAVDGELTVTNSKSVTTTGGASKVDITSKGAVEIKSNDTKNVVGNGLSVNAGGAVTVTGGGADDAAAAAIKGDANITAGGGVNVSNPDGIAVDGNLTIDSSTGVTVVGNTRRNAIRFGANITSSGAVNISNSRGIAVGGKLTVKNASGTGDVTVTGTGNATLNNGADITSRGAVSITNSSGPAIFGGLNVEQSGGITVTGSRASEPIITGNSTIKNTNKVEIINNEISGKTAQNITYTPPAGKGYFYQTTQNGSKLHTRSAISSTTPYLCIEPDTLYTLLTQPEGVTAKTNGISDTSFYAGEMVTVTAPEDTDTKKFEKWTFSGTEPTGLPNGWETSKEFTFKMPASNVTLGASYHTITKYEVKVTGGTIVDKNEPGKTTGSYLPGTEVKVAFTGSTGIEDQFEKWTLSGTKPTDLPNDWQSKPSFSFTMPEGDVTLKAGYKTVYNVSVADGKGTILVNGVAGSRALAGDKITVTETGSDEHHLFSSWKLTSSTLLVSPEDGWEHKPSFTFTMPAGDVSLKADYKQLYDLTVTGGTIVDENGDPGKPKGIYLPGTQVTVHFTESTDIEKQFKQWMYEGTRPEAPEGAGSEGGWDSSKEQKNITFTMPAGNVTLKAEYKTVYNVSVADSRGTVLVNNEERSRALEGETVTVKTSDTFFNAYHQFNGWSLSDDSAQMMEPSENWQTSKEFTFTMPAGNVTLKADYKQLYDLAVTGGTIVDESGDTGETTGIYLPGTEVTVVFDDSHDIAKQFKQWKSTDTEPEAPTAGWPEGGWQNSKKFTFKMPTGNVTLEAEYKTVYNVSVDENRGTVLVNDEERTQALEGETVTVKASDTFFDAYHEFDGWKFTSGTEPTGLPDGWQTSKEFTFKMPAGNVALTADYKQLYDLTVNGGTIVDESSDTGKPSGIYLPGTEVTIQFTDSDDITKQFKQWTYTGTAPEEPDGGWQTSKTFTFKMPAGNVSLSADYRKTYLIFETAGKAEFFAEGAEEQNIYEALPGTRIIAKVLDSELNDHRQFNMWRLGDISMELVNPEDGWQNKPSFSFAMPEGDVELQAYFTTLYDVNVTHGTIEGGTDDNGTSQKIVKPGQLVTVRAESTEENPFLRWNSTSEAPVEPDDGWPDGDWQTSKEFTFKMPEGNVTLEAQRDQLYKVSINDSLGSVTINGEPRSSLWVKEGETVTVATTLKDGYWMEFMKWTEQDGSAAPVEPDDGWPEGGWQTSTAFTFKMPNGPVELVAQWSASSLDPYQPIDPDEPLDEDFGVEPAPMDTTGGTIAAVAVGGAAIWGGYEIATRVILHSLLPEGTAIPANRGQLALLVWNTAGRPEPAGAPAFADMTDPDMAKAAQWCTEQGTMAAKGDRFEPEGWTPKFKVIEVWNKTFPAA